MQLYRRTEQAELDLIAAGVAFYGFLAIFPAVAAVIAIWGALSDPSLIRNEIALLQEILPPDAFALILARLRAGLNHLAAFINEASPREGVALLGCAHPRRKTA